MDPSGDAGRDTLIELSRPAAGTDLSLRDALSRRRSARSYGTRALSLDEISALLWAAQGVTSADGRRTAPSAGALYPLVVLLVAGEVEDLPAGVYRYDPAGHRLAGTETGDVRRGLARAALGQRWVRDAPAVLVLAARPGRTTGEYGRRGVRYVHMEAGHAGQNVYLQAEALGLGTVMVGAFRDEEVARTLQLAPGETPLGLMPVGPDAGGAGH